MSTTTPHRHGDTEKRPFDIDLAMARIREAVRPFPPAALFALAEEGFNSPFERDLLRRSASLSSFLRSCRAIARFASAILASVRPKFGCCVSRFLYSSMARLKCSMALS